MATVTLRKSGNSRVLTVPPYFDGEEGTVYKVESDNGKLIYTPQKHVNVFSTKEWKNFDYQKANEEILELAEVDPVGKERLL